MQAIQRASLLKEVILCGVEVLRRVICSDDAATKGRDLAGLICNWEHEAVSKCVVCVGHRLVA